MQHRSVAVRSVRPIGPLYIGHTVHSSDVQSNTIQRSVIHQYFNKLDGISSFVTDQPYSISNPLKNQIISKLKFQVSNTFYKSLNKAKHAWIRNILMSGTISQSFSFLTLRNYAFDCFKD